MPKSPPKPLTPEQKAFVVKFITKQKPKEAAKQERKLTAEYQDFLRRRGKVQAEICKFELGNVKRQALESELAVVDALQEKDGEANFKKAFDKLEKVKERAAKAAKGLPAFSAAKINKDIDAFGDLGVSVTDAVAKLFDDAAALGDEVRKHPKTSSFADVAKKLDYREKAFAAVEDDLRMKLAALAGQRDSILKYETALKLREKEKEIRKEISLLEAETPGSGAAVTTQLDQTLEAFKYEGQPVNSILLTARLAQSEAALEKVLAEWKEFGGQQRDAQPMPAKFKALEERDKRRVGAARLLLNREGLSDEQYLAYTKEPPKPVKPLDQWESSAEFQDLTDALPASEAETTPMAMQAGRVAAKKFVNDTMSGHDADSDLVFDLSIQTRPTLLPMLMEQMGLTDALRPDAAVVQEVIRLKKAGAKPKEDVYYKFLDQYSVARKKLEQTGDAAAYETWATKKISDIKTAGADPANNAQAKDLTALATRIQDHLDALPKKQIELANLMADDMLEAIAEGCPNTASSATTKLLIGNDGQTFDAPEKITLGGEEYTAQKCLGVGAFGVALRYQNSKGKAVVVKSFPSTTDKQKADITQELEMHRRLMAGDDKADGKANVVRLEGVARGADGGIHMVLEEADGGGLDSLGESLRALGNSNILSQEAQAAIRQNLVMQAVKGLKYLQGQNMTHHDIKADNLFMTADGVVKLADFGNAKASDNPEGEVPNLVDDQDKMGKKEFVAPETRAGAPTVTGKSDTYALGALIAKLNSPSDAVDKTLLAHAGDFDYTSGKNVTALDRLTNAMLDPDPKKRPRIEAVEYAAYLTEGAAHDPDQVQDLIKASIAYSQKAGKEVGEAQQNINQLQGFLIAGEVKAAASPDDKLAKDVQNGNAAAAARTSLEESAKHLSTSAQSLEKKVPHSLIMEAATAQALKSARDAEKLCALGKVTDPALLGQVKGQLEAATLQFNKIADGLRADAAAEQQKIDAVNARPEVALLLAAVKEANDALLAGADGEPDAKMIAFKKKAVEKSITEYKLPPKDYSEDLKNVDALVKAEKHGEANEILKALQDRIREEKRTPDKGKIEAKKKRLGKLITDFKLPTGSYAEGLKNADALALAGKFAEADKALSVLEGAVRLEADKLRVTARIRGYMADLKKSNLGAEEQKRINKFLADAAAFLKLKDVDAANKQLSGVELMLKGLA